MVTELDGRTFDWRPRFDERSRAYGAAPGVTTLPTSGRLWHTGPVLDQGQEGACVGFACSGAVAAEPSARPGISDTYALSWYHAAQRRDPWPGEGYSGTSVLAGCLVGRARRLWTGFRWAFSPPELAHGILSDDLGPAVLGVQWSESLYDTDHLGILRADGGFRGDLGHSLLMPGFLPENADDTLREDLEELDLLAAYEAVGGPAAVLLNSWGPGFGRHGLALAPWELIEAWFARRGEFGLPEGRRPRRKAGAPMTAVEQDEGGSGTTTVHVTAADVIEQDRILDPPEELGQESVTVTGAPRFLRGWGGRQVRIPTTAGTITLGAGTPVVVRRPQ